MRFRTKQSRMGKCLGRKFTKRKFLWLPVEVYGEVRWLEYADIRYRIVFSFSEIRDYKWTIDSFV